jgi:hypothetical protein
MGQHSIILEHGPKRFEFSSKHMDRISSPKPSGLGMVSIPNNSAKVGG